MHRTSGKRLLAFIVSLGACLVLTASPARNSAPDKAVQSGGAKVAAEKASAPKVSGVGKKPATKPAAKPRRQKRTSGESQISVSGTVTDGGGHGWPLYARLDFTSSTTEPVSYFSDPVTGQYQGSLFDGVEYTVVVTALVTGYVPNGGTFTTEGSPVIQDWALGVEAYACNAPGYAPDGSSTVFSESFDSGELPDGWSIDSESGAANWSIWEGADPCGQFEGNDTGGSGPFALINSNCDSDLESVDDSSLVTPSLDLSALPSAALRWNNEYIDFDSIADVDVSTDGGGTWTNVWERVGVSEPGPQVQGVNISAFAGQASVQIRFHYQAFFGFWWQVDNVTVAQPICSPLAGGLVVGNVRDGNTGDGVNGAAVTSTSSPATTKAFDPGDPDGDTGFYYLFQPAGPQSLQASAPAYSPDSEPVTVFTNDAVRRDFTLQAGMVDASPRPVSAVIPPNGLSSKTLTLTNSGQPDAAYSIFEIYAPVAPSNTSGFASKKLREQALARLPKITRKSPATKDTKGLAPLPQRPDLRAPERVLAGGEVLASYMLNIIAPWGISYDLNSNDPWVSDFEYFGGSNFEYEYTANGVPTGNTIDATSFAGPNSLLADGTFNQRTGMIWQVLADTTDQCIHEMDPVTMTVTGNTICPNWGGLSFGERGLAYDYATDTYYSGSWEDGVINHFDSSGTILDSAFVALNISGLAYFPSSGHLFVMVNDLDEPITVLDTRNNYAVVGSFEVTQNGQPVFGQGAGAGMEADCLGNLWLVNQVNGKLYKVASGESGSPGGCSVDIPWLTVSPTGGTVPGTSDSNVGSGVPVMATFNSTGMLPGLQQGQLQIYTDTPYAVAPVPVDITVLFNDVPQGSFAWNFIYGAAGAGVMFGGPPVCSSIYSFCPNGIVTRADMAGYIFRAVHGRNTAPPVYQNQFADVAFNDYNAFYIQGIADDGITAGCGGGNYCPTFPNTRAQMSVFIYKGQHGSTPPPACTTQVFGDVPCGSFAADYINALAAEGVTAGCGGGNFCPDSNITNAQMAVFLVKGFNIPYLP